MYDEPDDISADDIARVLRQSWSIEASDTTYQAVGFGSYHWRVTDVQHRRWFITVDRLDKLSAANDETFERLRAAYRPLQRCKCRATTSWLPQSRTDTAG